MGLKSFLKGALWGTTLSAGAIVYLTSTSDGKKLASKLISELHQAENLTKVKYETLVKKFLKRYFQKSKAKRAAVQKLTRELLNQWETLDTVLSEAKSKKGKA